MSALAKDKLVCVLLLSLLVAGCGPAPAFSPTPSAVTRISPATHPPATLTPLPPTLTLTPLRPTKTPTPAATTTATYSAATPTATQLAASTFDGVRVTYVFSAGFLITAGDRRVLIDAIYEGYPEGTLKPILRSQPPFDGVDLILATHEHVDHFSPALVRGYMLANPNTVFASTYGAAGLLLALGDNLSSRVISIDIAEGESRELQVNGITAEAVYLSHGIPRLLNLGFVITFGGVVLFHTGDVEDVDLGYLQSYGLPGKQIDVGFVPQFFFMEEAYYDLMVEGIGARTLIPMHFHGRFSPPARFESLFPNYHIFGESYESWVLSRP